MSGARAVGDSYAHTFARTALDVVRAVRINLCPAPWLDSEHDHIGSFSYRKSVARNTSRPVDGGGERFPAVTSAPRVVDLNLLALF